MKSKRDPRRRPTHPGEVLREDVLPALGMSQTEFARRLGVSRLSVYHHFGSRAGVLTAVAEAAHGSGRSDWTDLRPFVAAAASP